MNEIVGSWRLERYEAGTSTGETAYPLGKDADGYLVYTADGHMSATLTRRGRSPFADATRSGATTQEKVRAYDDYVAYAGRYEIRDDTVVHHVDCALFPNWVGQPLERFFERHGDTLIITTGAFGAFAEHRLVWKRATAH
jgi:hypothetical protein